MTAGGQVDGYLDGFTIGYLPAGLGELVSDFSSEWEEVRITSRVWERQTADGYQVDLRIHVLRGERLTDLPALRDFLAEYHEVDPEQWSLVEFQHGALAGLVGAAEAFWLVAPGLAVEVRIDPERLSADELRAVAGGVRAVDAP